MPVSCETTCFQHRGRFSMWAMLSQKRPLPQLHGMVSPIFWKNWFGLFTQEKDLKREAFVATVLHHVWDLSEHAPQFLWPLLDTPNIYIYTYLHVNSLPYLGVWEWLTATNVLCIPLPKLSQTLSHSGPLLPDQGCDRRSPETAWWWERFSWLRPKFPLAFAVDGDAINVQNGTLFNHDYKSESNLSMASWKGAGELGSPSGSVWNMYTDHVYPCEVILYH